MKIFKRIIAGLTAGIMTLGLFALSEMPFDFSGRVSASAQTGTYGDLSYKITDSKITITDCDKSAISVEIPAEIEGYPVTGIGYASFEYCYNLTSIIIPDSVISIGHYAFSYCSSLTSVKIGNSVTDIGVGVFSYSGIVSIEIPNSVTWISSEMFYKCSDLTSIILPDSIEGFSIKAFEGCRNLTSITILGTGFIAGTDRVFDDSIWYKNQPDGMVYLNKIAYGYKGEMPENTALAIKEGTMGISGSAFYNYTNLTSVTIPDSVIHIGYFAFAECSNLASITIPDSVTGMGHDAFTGTAWYNNQPNGIIYAGKVACGYKGNMANITRVTFSEGTLGIAQGIFYSCRSLTTITIPSSVVSIGGQAFFDCPGINSVTIPPSVTVIGWGAFGYNNEFGPIDGFVISGYKNTAAESYALENGFTFIALDSPFLLGDPDGDGIITVSDALLTLQLLAGTQELTEAQIKAADVNGDGEVTSYDALLILQYEAEVITEFPTASA